MIRCFKVKSSNEIFTSLFSSLNIKANEIVCIDDESQWLINLSKRRAFILLPEEMDNLLKLPNEINNEFKVEVVSRHRYEPRKHYTIYSIYKVSPGKKPRRRYFIEVYDGSSASYAFFFCYTRAKCMALEKDLEEDNIMLY
jgi:hypothetical protein